MQGNVKLKSGAVIIYADVKKNVGFVYVCACVYVQRANPQEYCQY